MTKATTKSGVFLLALMLAVLVVFSGVALAKVIKGTNGQDRLIGTNGFDRINGYGGADFIDGGLGGDRLTGGRGNDTMYDGPIRDRSKDVIVASAGNDTVNIANKPNSRDIAYCGGGFDTLIADRRIDRQSGCERIRIR